MTGVDGEQRGNARAVRERTPDLVLETDVREQGGRGADGERVVTDRRLFMQFLAFGGAPGPELARRSAAPGSGTTSGLRVTDWTRTTTTS
jgi:hypothetical protein